MPRRDPERLKKYLENDHPQARRDREGAPPSDRRGLCPAGFRAPRRGRWGCPRRMPPNLHAADWKRWRGGRRRPSPSSSDFEAIIFEDIRPAIDIVDGAFTVTHPLWTQLSSDAAIRTRIEAAIPLVGRIELPGNAGFPMAAPASSSATPR